MELSKNYLGVGIVYPFQLENGRLPLNNTQELIKCNIRNLLSYQLGKRLMQGEIGSRLKSLISDNPTQVLKQTLGFFIKEVLEVYEPRVIFLSERTQLTVDNLTGRVEANLFFIERRTQSEFSFVLPFYKTPKSL